VDTFERPFITLLSQLNTKYGEVIGQIVHSLLMHWPETINCHIRLTNYLQIRSHFILNLEAPIYIIETYNISSMP